MRCIWNYIKQRLVVSPNTLVLDSAERGVLGDKSTSILFWSLCLSTRSEVVKLVVHRPKSDSKHILFGCTVLKKKCELAAIV